MDTPTSANMLDTVSKPAGSSDSLQLFSRLFGEENVSRGEEKLEGEYAECRTFTKPEFQGLDAVSYYQGELMVTISSGNTDVASALASVLMSAGLVSSDGVHFTARVTPGVMSLTLSAVAGDMKEFLREQAAVAYDTMRMRSDTQTKIDRFLAMTVGFQDQPSA